MMKRQALSMSLMGGYSLRLVSFFHFVLLLKHSIRPELVFFNYRCRWHGHSCFQDRYAKDPRTGDSMQTLYASTLNKEESLRAAGYKVVTKWECHWHEELTRDTVARQFVEELETVPRLKVRDSFFG